MAKPKKPKKDRRGRNATVKTVAKSQLRSKSRRRSIDAAIAAATSKD